MIVHISFNGKVQEYAGEAGTQLHIADSSDIADLLQVLTLQKPGLSDVTRYLFISVNNEMSPRNRRLQDGDQVALFFRMGGG